MTNSLFTNIKNLDRKFAWSFLGVLIAIAFGIQGIYTTYFYEKKPNLSFEIISKNRVVELNEDISNIDILYNKENIKDNNQNLLIYTIRIINKGKRSIFEQSYASNDRLRLVIEDGELVANQEIINGSSNYLKDKSNLLEIDSNHTVLLPNLFLESNEFYDLKLMLLHSIDNEPILKVKGKIEGQKNIEISETTEIKDNQKEKPSGWIVALSIIGFIVGIFILGSIADLIISYYKKMHIKYTVRNRKNKLANFFLEKNIVLNNDIKTILNSYTEIEYQFQYKTSLNRIKETCELLEDDKAREYMLFYKKTFDSFEEKNWEKQKLHFRKALQLIYNGTISISEEIDFEKIDKNVIIIDSFLEYIGHKRKNEEEESASNKVPTPLS